MFGFRATEKHNKLQHYTEINFASNKITNSFGRGLKITLLVKHVKFIFPYFTRFPRQRFLFRLFINAVSCLLCSLRSLFETGNQKGKVNELSKKYFKIKFILNEK